MVMNMINATGSRRRAGFISTVAALCALSALVSTNQDFALGCGGCDSIKETLAEEISGSAAAVICKLVARPAAADGAAPTCTFEVVESLKGTLVAEDRIEILYAGDAPLGSTFYARAEAPPMLVWFTPTKLTAREIDYLRKLGARPAAGPERLAATYDYLEAPEPLLAADAYEEFARATFVDVAATKDRMPREKLLKWIGDVEVQTGRRKQYLYMLAICGTSGDLPMLEELMRRGDQATSRILEAVIGCYLAMRGVEGLPLVEELFFRDAAAEYVDTYAAIKALRFTAVESRAIDRERINQSFRLVLDRPQLADLVVPDLTRGRDWSAAPQLAAIFRDAAKNETLWMRIPIAEYFRRCPTPAAVPLRKELETLDPTAFARAVQMYGEHGPATEPIDQPAQ